MDSKDIRWHQRLSNFKKALEKLNEINNLDQNKISDLEKEGIIQRFEFTHELAWNLMKDYIEYQGTVFIAGSRDATREAFKMGLLNEGEIWMDMIKSRNLSTHTYNEEISRVIFLKIIQDYLPLFIGLEKTMDELMKNDH